MDNLIDILKSLSPLEVLEVLGMDDDTENLVNALSEVVDSSYEQIKTNLISMGLMDDDSEEE